MTDVRDEVVARALGEELRRARESIGWTRDELAGRMTTEIQPRTIASYEQGARYCTVVRLAEICRTLRISAPELLGMALQRAEIDLNTISLQVDLHALTRDDSDELRPLRAWADRRLALNPESRVAVLKVEVVQEMAILFDYTRSQLVRYLTKFTPPAIAHP
ncbi:helix-turn-helix domain-containing protein [Actinophytocola sp.]|uniref:helix-turn-helix domain-containing protein n=1 Tax=Actinophytocola sp. TaxID=1872138 RepID=UPI00389B00B6